MLSPSERERFPAGCGMTHEPAPPPRLLPPQDVISKASKRTRVCFLHRASQNAPRESPWFGVHSAHHVSPSMSSRIARVLPSAKPAVIMPV